MSTCLVNTQIAIVPDPIAAPIIACDTVSDEVNDIVPFVQEVDSIVKRIELLINKQIRLEDFIQEGNPYLTLLSPDDDNEEEIKVFSDHDIDDQDVHAGGLITSPVTTRAKRKEQAATPRAKPTGVETFGKEFTAVIEAKQIDAQEAERAKFVVEKAEQDKKGAVIKAQGEAKSAQLIGQALSKQCKAFITLRKIEASQEIAHTIANFANRVYLNSR
ncbi:hypothetical protein IFM89_015974 [Coptis chinensis]|uniref:Prohibitin n=1 Tax=Coptis chinensis TaxID=261450 RepID=A0A835LW16_9MAGN|nr:hypothetical protein IFM89_015974 [Coptis chinensis]